MCRSLCTDTCGDELVLYADTFTSLLTADHAAYHSPLDGASEVAALRLFRGAVLSLVPSLLTAKDDGADAAGAGSDSKALMQAVKADEALAQSSKVTGTAQGVQAEPRLQPHSRQRLPMAVWNMADQERTAARFRAGRRRCVLHHVQFIDCVLHVVGMSPKKRHVESILVREVAWSWLVAAT